MEIKEDEKDIDGKPYCLKCGKPRFFVLEENGVTQVIRILCDCQRAEYNRKAEEKLLAQRREKFLERQKLSTMGNKYLEANFATAKITENNKKAYEKAQNYTKNAKEMIKNNIGLYIYGDNSSGKTYYSACICNELIARGFLCYFVNIPQIIADIDSKKITYSILVQKMSVCDFLFIDDIGKEFLGRKEEWTYSKGERILLDILNRRYSYARPTIFTSNYSLNELANRFNLDKAILERINEMSTKVIHFKGDNFRNAELARKSEIAKKFGI